MPQYDNSRGGQTRARRAKPKRKPRPYTPTTVAGEGSRPENRTARAPEPRTAPLPVAQRPPAFRPLGAGKPGQTRPGEQTRRELRNRSAKARGKLQDHPAIPNIPVKQHYDEDERHEIAVLMRAGVKRAGVDSIRELLNLGSRRQRARMRSVGRNLVRSINPSNIHEAEPRSDDVRSGGGVLDSGQVKIAGVGVDFRIPGTRRNVLGVARDVGRVTSPLPLPGTVFGELTRATAEDPAAVAKTTLRTTVESVAGIPQGVKEIVENPSGALKAIAEDYEKRYGPIFNDPAKFREAVKSDYGLTPYALDALTAAAAGGRAVSAAGRVPAVQRAAAALAERAPGGRAVERTLTASQRERPNLRTSAGEEGVRRQRTSPNAFKALAQHASDRSRQRAFDARAERAGVRRGDDGELEPVDGAPPARLPGLRPGQGEVLAGERRVAGVTAPDFRELPGMRRLAGRVARDVGGQQSVTRTRMLTRRGRVLERIRKATSRLTPEEQLGTAYMLKLGVTPDRNGVRALEAERDRIRAAREEDGFEVPAVLRETNDELAMIDRILEDPDAHLTPEARAAADELRDIQRETAGRDPTLTPDQELIRRMTRQGETLDVTRGPDVEFFRGVLRQLEEDTGVDGLAARADELAALPPAERAAVARDLLKAGRKQRKAAERDVGAADRRAAVFGERVRSMEDRGQPLTTPELTEARREVAAAKREVARLRGELKGRRGEHIKVPGVRSGGDFRIADLREELKAAEDRLKGARANLTEQLRAAPRVTEKQAQRAATAKLEAAAARETLDAARATEKALKKVVKASKSKRTMRLEDAESFAEKVRAAAEEAGLAEPAYWWSSIRPETTAALAATGKGGRATARNKRYQGKVARVGAEEMGLDVFTKGVERNIKRRFQHALVARNVATHAFEWSKGEHGEGVTVQQARKLFDERRIDPGSVELVNANLVVRGAPDEAGVKRGRVADEPGVDQVDDAVHADDLERTASQEFGQARRPAPRTDEEWERLAMEAGGQAMNRYYVVTKDVADALDSALVRAFDSTGARAFEILLKSKPSRIMLGAANVPWLAFQIASNTFLTGLGGGLNPFNVHGAYKWFRGLDEEAREAVEAELGITHGHSQFQDQPHLGASSNRMVAFWRGYKASRVGRLGHRINPLNVLFRADEAQNNFFRKVLFYDAARKQAYRRMGSSWRGIDTGISRLTERVLAKPPDRQAELIARHGEDFEKVAGHVRDFLGDYLRFSSAERMLLSRNVMFYGYLRFSLRFTFYTMPVAHPIMTNLLTQIGRMGAQEIKELFGVPDNYRLPTSMLANVYFGDERDAQAGELRSAPWGRMNPALNAITQMEGGQQAVGLVSPLYQAVVDQMFEESSFTGRDWRILGEPLPTESERPKDYYGSMLSLLNPTDYAIPGVSEGKPRNRILQRDLFGLAPPYRFAEKAALGPSQSDDALAWSPRPIQYSEQGDAARPVRRARREFFEPSFLERFGRQLGPMFFPQPTQAPAVIEREREKEADAANRRMGKRKPRRRSSSAGRYGGGGSSGNRYGGSGSSGDRGYGG